MVFLRAFLGGLIGAIIGAAAWAAVAYFLNISAGILAWGIGALAGFGALWMGSREESNVTGAAAVLAAVLGLFGGKYATASILVGSFLGQLSTVTTQSYTDENLIVILAEEELDAIEAAGRSDTLKWPRGMDRQSAEHPDDYPEIVTKRASQKLAKMTPDEKEAFKQKTIDDLNALMNVGQSSLTFGVFRRMFTLFDLLWFTLAAVSAWKIGAQDDTQ